MRLCTVFLYFCKLLYMFRVVTPSIIRSTYNCNYSIWHWSNRLCCHPVWCRGWNDPILTVEYISCNIVKCHKRILAGDQQLWILKDLLSIFVQQDATMYSFLYFCKLLYMFRLVTPPIIRSTYNCNHSIWHWSNPLCYYPLRWRG